ncbi:MAG: hypothetical protein F4Z04_18200 [Acidobacteria bacterium]|nr:hypothetical protein [Acidobacteriota bacterium]
MTEPTNVATRWIDARALLTGMTLRPPAARAAAVVLALLATAVIMRPAPAGAQTSTVAPTSADGQPSTGAQASADARASTDAQAPAGVRMSEVPTRLFALDFGRRLIGVQFNTIHLFLLHDESGDFRTYYDAERALALNASLAWRLGRRRLGGYFGLGLGFSRIDKPMTVQLDARVPHPYILSFPREFETFITGLTRREMGIDVQGQYWRALTDRLLLRGFAGPTIFIARQDAVTHIGTGDVMPSFDQAFLTGHRVAVARATKLGYNIGADVTWLLNDRVGLGGGVRYSRASITSHDIPRTPVPFALGGPNLAGGLRLRF